MTWEDAKDWFKVFLVILLLAFAITAPFVELFIKLHYVIKYW